MNYNVGEYVGRNLNNENIYVRDYEVGKTIADKMTFIREVSGLTQNELGRVLGYKSNEVHYIEGGFIPSKNVIAVINKLYRLWYELVNEK